MTRWQFLRYAQRVLLSLSDNVRFVTNRLSAAKIQFIFK